MVRLVRSLFILGIVSTGTWLGNGVSLAAAGITLSPTEGAYNRLVTVTGSGFGATETVKVYWDSTATTPVTSATASGGSFTATFNVPQATRGTHTVIAKGQTSGSTANQSFKVVSKVLLLHRSGTAGSANTATAYGFAASEIVNVYWNAPSGTSLGSGTATASGTATINFTVPTSATPGTYAVYAVGATSGASAFQSFTVVGNAATLALSPNRGPHGSLSTATGTGYKPSETVTIKGNCSPTSCTSPTVLGTVKADASGNFSLAITIPTTVPAGAYSIAGQGGTSGAVAYATFTVKPSVSIVPNKGPAGSSATFTGSSYGANETVTVKWNCDPTTCTNPTVLGSQKTDASGDFSLAITVPAGAAIGTYSVEGVGGTSGLVAYTHFYVR